MKHLLLFILVITSPSPKEWKAAESVVEKNSGTWIECFRSLDAEPKECEAIIFPEILRHNRFVDKVQTTVLLGAYLNEGKESANYSIGIFQMKPSFAEDIEEAWMNSSLSSEYELYFDISQRKEARHKRMRRLQSEEWQAIYLAMFYRLMLEREPTLLDKSPEQRVKYLATAYNYKFQASLSELEARMKVKSFHLDFIRLKSTKLYCYCELSVKRYKQLK